MLPAAEGTGGPRGDRSSPPSSAARRTLHVLEGEPQGGERATRPGGPGAAGRGTRPAGHGRAAARILRAPRPPFASPRRPSPRHAAHPPRLGTPAPAAPRLTAPPPRLASPHLSTPAPASPRLTSVYRPPTPSQPPAQPPHRWGGKGQTLASERSVAKAGAGLLAGRGVGNMSASKEAAGGSPQRRHLLVPAAAATWGPAICPPGRPARREWEMTAG